MAKTFFWLRRDLRLEDNAALYHALKENDDVQCVFIFDKNILSKLPSQEDARVEFIHQTIQSLKQKLVDIGSDLWVYYGDPQSIWADLISQNTSSKLYFNRDYEPSTKARDKAITELFTESGGDVHAYKDHVIFEQDEVTKDDGLPYTVFTPYKRKWLKALDSDDDYSSSYYLSSYPCSQYYHHLSKHKSLQDLISLDQMGFKPTEIEIPGTEVSQSLIKNYEEKRNFPALNGTSRLGIHFRFGTISIREKARKAARLSAIYLSELIWRDFYSQILYHFPYVADRAFRPKYEGIEWRNNEAEFEKWCKGQTGYPIVDAGMRELNTTGFMHNRVRMITASFLTKHLLIDWRWGEQYFADKLLDFDLASNNGGWQWAAGCGTDAAPYFRIFNPHTQFDKFDKNEKYVKQFVPEYGTDDYFEYIVDHKLARERCLATYKKSLDAYQA